MTLTRLSDLPYVQANGDGGPRSQTQLIVFHATDNTASDEDESNYSAHRADKTSCHVVIDDDSAIQNNMLDHIAYGCFSIGNGRSIQIELCGKSGQLSPAVIARGAKLAAQIAGPWGIPIQRPTPEQMRAGAKGIVGHADVTLAWGQGDHTDPGANFDWPGFITQVQAEANRLNPAPTPTPPPSAWLRRAWPSYMPAGHYFGNINGPAASHGGYRLSDRPDIERTQERLNALGFNCGRPDGIIGPNTVGAIASWQRALYAAFTSRYGEVWPDDWRRLHTY